MRQNDGDWKEGEGDERGDHQRLPADPVGEPGGRQVAQDRRGHLHPDQQAKLGRGDSHDVQGVQHEEDVHHPLAGADEDVRQQEPAQRHWKRSPDAPGIGVVGGRERETKPGDDEEGQQRQRDRQDQADAHAVENPVARDEQPTKGRGDRDGNPPEDRLDGEAHRPALAGERIAHDGEERGTGHAGPGHHEHARPGARPATPAPQRSRHSQWLRGL